MGYGFTTMGSRRDGSRKTITTHRAMMLAVHGAIPPGLWVLHKCDNRKCINPDHLYFGDRSQNVNDMINRGRCTVPRLKHENHPNAKLSWNDVNEIRKIKGKTQKQISEKFNVSREAIKDIVNYRTWVTNTTTE